MIPYIILAIENDSDRDFMSQLYVTYEKLMYSEVGKIAHDPWATEDIVQDTLVKLIDKIGLLRQLPSKKLINYIISASKNTAFNYLKRKENRDILAFDEIELQSKTETPLDRGPEVKIVFEEDLRQLSRIWGKLDERSKYLLEGRYILGKTSAEMAEDLGIKPDSIRMALTRARQTAYKYIADKD